MKTLSDPGTCEQAAALLTALENPKRLEILQILLSGERSVTELSKMVRLSQSALSQHLAKLRAAKVVETRRDRQTVYYACHSDAVIQLLRTLNGIYADSRQPGTQR